MKVVPVPCLRDNYAYLVIAPGGEAAVIDPGEALPIEAALAAHGATLRAVWATHHHHDHIGGITALLARFADLEVVAHAHDRDRVTGATRIVEDGDAVAVGAVHATIVHNPGHTLGAISYAIAPARDRAGALFTGDTLFGAGCGRLFEGSAAQMHASLSRLAGFHRDTRVYFGHEYTAANLRFAAAVEGDNAAIAARRGQAATATATWPRQAEMVAVTTPSTIGDELATNPFLRTDLPAVIAAAASREPALDPADRSAVFAALRRWKDLF